MLLFASLNGQPRIYYSRLLVVLATLAILVAPVIGAVLLSAETCWVGERSMMLLDVMLGWALLYPVGGPFLYFSLRFRGARPELYAMRVASALVVAGSCLTIVVSTLPRV